jgi:hypothetical protein
VRRGYEPIRHHVTGQYLGAEPLQLNDRRGSAIVIAEEGGNDRAAFDIGSGDDGDFANG